MNGQPFSGLYIEAGTNPRTVLPYLCGSGYYCLLLAALPSESDAKYGRLHYDFCDGTLIAYRANTVCAEVPPSCLWMVAFHPGLCKELTWERQTGEYSFFAYAPDEALHLSQKESRILTSCFSDIRKELQQNTDPYKPSILNRHILRLLNYTTRFYERQFIVREPANEGLIQQYEALVRQAAGKGKPAWEALTSAYCAAQLHLSEAYFEDLLEFHLGHTHNCHMQLQRIEAAKERLRTSRETLSQIVRELGFPSVQYFCFLFKKITGITPDEYKLIN